MLTLLFVVSLPAVTTRLYASDEIEYFAYLRSLYFDQDLSFDNEYRYFYDRNIARAHFFKETFLDFTTPTGLRRNFAPIGSALLWAPFYAVADVGVRAAFVVAWLYVRYTWSVGGVVLLGALAALMGMVREQDVFIAIGPAIDYVATMWREVRQGRRSVREMVWKAALGVATVIVGFLPQALT